MATARAASPAKQLASFIAKFDPTMQRKIRACRSALRKRLPTANELVYDNYNFFVIGYGATERPSDCFISLVANAKGVGLCFLYGATLPDPKNILLGNGSQTRFVRLEGAATLSKSPVAAMIRSAAVHAKAALPRSGGGLLVIRSVSAQQRPRR